MYEAEKNCVYYINPEKVTRELFLTVLHISSSHTRRTAMEQVAAIAHILNNDASLRYRIFGIA